MPRKVHNCLICGHEWFSDVEHQESCPHCGDPDVETRTADPLIRSIEEHNEEIEDHPTDIDP